VHKVENFENGADKTLNGDAIADPTIDDDNLDAGAAYVSYAGKPLFGTAGPSSDDVHQQYLNDCWLLATLGAVADANQNAIFQAVVDLGDGTYCVELDNKQYRVDPDLAVRSDGDFAYARLGQDDSLWVALVEKAYALHRDGTYASIDGDTPYWAMGKLDGINRVFSGASGDGTDEAEKVQDWLDWGYAVVFCTKNDLDVLDPLFGAPSIVENHCYTVTGVDWVSERLILRNPWGGATAEISIAFDEIAEYGANPWCFFAGDFSRFD
jgi:hypothetical protein